MESKRRPPCWYVLVPEEENPEKPGWHPVPVDIAVGLDLPLPLDGTPLDEVADADLDYKKSARSRKPIQAPNDLIEVEGRV